jgi:carboxymethylenebutenolidase
MIYEILGMSDEMRRVARDLAAEGYAVLIPDLFARGRVRPLCVAATMRTMVTGSGAAMDDLEAARRWLADRPEVDGTRLGTIGFCMGGSFALLLARTGLYKVSAPFYGRPPDLPRSCPVVASFGGRDLGMRGAPEKLTADLDAAGVPHDVKVYPDAGHSFFTRTPGLKGSWCDGCRSTPSTTRPARRTRTAGSSRSSGSTRRSMTQPGGPVRRVRQDRWA